MERAEMIEILLWVGFLIISVLFLSYHYMNRSAGNKNYNREDFKSHIRIYGAGMALFISFIILYYIL